MESFYSDVEHLARGRFVTNCTTSNLSSEVEQGRKLGKEMDDDVLALFTCYVL